MIKGKKGIVTILGRDFQTHFGKTTFDWKNSKVYLGEECVSPNIWIYGRNREERIAVAQRESQKPISDVNARKITTLEFNINPKLTLKQPDQFRKMLSKYPEAFAEEPKKPSSTSKTEHVIETYPDTRPIKSKRFRMSPQEEKEIEQQADEMLRNNVARESNSPWASNVILVRQGEKTRFAIDYTKLNDATVKDSYPMPNVKDILDRMLGSEYFTKLDLASAYWAISIREEDRHKTAFMTQ